MRADLLVQAAQLVERGEAFALVTVVGREAPSSVRVGDAAIVTGAGSIRGWIGGSCTQETVVRESLAALADGRPRLIALSPDAVLSGDGRTVLPMTCLSGGRVDLFIEPQLPPPRLVVLGASPVAQALVRLGKAMGYAVDAADPTADRAAFPDADRVLTDPAELQGASQSGASARFVVVATMGQWDEEATFAALALEPAYVGVVASSKRAARLREALEARGLAGAALARLRGPAGLDLGAETPEEIALSVLAEIVRSRRAGTGTEDVTTAAGRRAATGAEAEAATSGSGASDGPRARAQRSSAAGSVSAAAPDGAPSAVWAQDPVCGMRVATAGPHQLRLGDRTFHFCCAGCRERFAADPERYLATAGTKTS
jgi:xanthine dehydrogenase accessory factor